MSGQRTRYHFSKPGWDLPHVHTDDERCIACQSALRIHLATCPHPGCGNDIPCSIHVVIRHDPEQEQQLVGGDPEGALVPDVVEVHDLSEAHRGSRVLFHSQVDDEGLQWLRSVDPSVRLVSVKHKAGLSQLRFSWSGGADFFVGVESDMACRIEGIPGSLPLRWEGDQA